MFKPVGSSYIAATVMECTANQKYTIRWIETRFQIHEPELFDMSTIYKGIQNADTLKRRKSALSNWSALCKVNYDEAKIQTWSSKATWRRMKTWKHFFSTEM